MDIEKKTARVYGLLWRKNKSILSPTKWHYNDMIKAIREPIVRGVQGIDIGSGCGYDTYIMAKNNPTTKIASIDLSNGVYKTQELTSGLKNVQIIKCSVLNAPLKNNIFDFAYSYGVLHHTPDPQKGLLEIARILKKGSPAFLYLYEDHSGNFVKYIAVKIVAKLRKFTVKLSPRVLNILSWMFSPFVFVIFSFPSKVLRRFKATQNFTKKIPFNYGKNPFSLRGDLYDRISAPIEHRFSGEQVHELFTKCGFREINIARLNDKAGWVVWGYKS